MFKLSVIDKVSFLLVLIGALNWGLVGLANFDLVQAIFGSIPLISRIVYILIGAAAINIIFVLFSNKLIAPKFKR
ncbi:DUF378 domain-containing protein [Alloiococcus sp. CFN-8]|uniref:DUF378 domain-containing protein n=1 Tax=Alloiococcus sp. CFN-8 TaxID=3416081 RepID=UPI003CF5BEFB